MRPLPQKTLLLLFIFGGLILSCRKESGSISGSWVTPMENEPQHQYGFTLKDEGTAASINVAAKAYEKWEKFGDRLILYGRTTSREDKSSFSDTLKIISVHDSMLVLQTAGGKQIHFTRTQEPDKLITDFENYDCYAHSTKKDTAFLKINTANNVITGNLDYYIYEKDSNKGTLKGTLKGDTLIADYTFVAEGTNSTRQVVMIRKGNDFIEGFGETEEKDNKVIFRDRAKLNFRKGLLFKKTACP